MTVAEIIFDSGIGLVAILTLIQITPIKINPWSAIARAIGKPITSAITAQLETIEKTQREMKQTLDNHIREDAERNADASRSRILEFNSEVMRGLLHTQEEFVEILSEIDRYDHYCKSHPDYPNRRAIHAVDNIERIYRERLEKNDFLK